MVTGRVPFEGDTALAIAVKQKTENPVDPREFNTQLLEDLNSLILKCLEKDKDNRYQSAEELRSGLEHIERSIPTTDRTAPLKKPLTSKEITVTFRAKRVLIPALIIFCIALIGLFFWHPWSRYESPPPEIDKPSIAVLPFEDLSPERDQDYLCVGLAESLINALSKIQSLRVPARTSSFSFQGKDTVIRDIGEKLDVKTVLTGSLQRQENTIRISTQLINVADESLLWSEQYNRELDDVFQIQDEISRNIVETLKVKLVAGERAVLTKRDTTNAEAYQLYLQGRYFRWIENVPNFLKAKNYFEQAVENDPNYSSAYAGLANTYMLLDLFSAMPKDEAAQQAKRAARRALELDENSSEAHASMGVILEVFDWDWAGAEREFKRAIELNPNHFDAHYEYGFLLGRLKRLDEAEDELKRALRIDPLSVRGHQVLALIYRFSGNEEKADEHYRMSNELIPQTDLGENALDRAKRLIDRDGRLPQRLRQLSVAYIESGKEAEARKVLNELERLYEESGVGNIAYQLARVYRHYDNENQTLIWLERSYEKRDSLLISLNINTYFYPYRENPRFKSIVAKMGLE
jgi:TolB-like protein/Tfp pilus assembly protein PilF